MHPSATALMVQLQGQQGKEEFWVGSRSCWESCCAWEGCYQPAGEVCYKGCITMVGFLEVSSSCWANEKVLFERYQRTFPLQLPGMEGFKSKAWTYIQPSKCWVQRSRIWTMTIAQSCPSLYLGLSEVVMAIINAGRPSSGSHRSWLFSICSCQGCNVLPNKRELCWSSGCEFVWFDCCRSFAGNHFFRKESTGSWLILIKSPEPRRSLCESIVLQEAAS